jgi:asparagine synthase (glutamine-hydrolysing)
VSGLAAIVRTDGAPVPDGLIDRLTASLAMRGPDAQTTWCAGEAALGHARLQIGAGATPQPLTLDGNTWIVADARVDDRETLASALGMPSGPAASDAELILRAFIKWDARCVEHLLGDFAFAIWNRGRRRLFCARDHLGVKPLYYVDGARWLLVSSAVDSLRQHPAVSEELDDLAVADFLLFGPRAEPAATTFRDIRRVPPAHALTWSPQDGCRVRRYWELPIEEPVYLKDGEYAARLRELLDRAVSDRLGTDRVGILFSGGLDSACVAATARRRMHLQAAGSVRAFCFVHESLIPDTEREFAAATASHLGMPCQFYVADASSAWQQDGAPPGPEPLQRSIDPSIETRCLADMAAHSRVAFSGDGPDNALTYEWASYVSFVWRSRRYGRLAADAAKFVMQHRRMPLWSIVAGRQMPPRPDASEPLIPTWMNRELIVRLRLEERARFVMRPAESKHPVKPHAWFSLQLPLWHTVFDAYDPAYTGVALDVRHPFLDLRVLRFLLTVPAIPWCRRKHLLRYAFRSEIPSRVLARAKTPLQGSPEHQKIRRDGLPPLLPSTRLERYASRGALQSVSSAAASMVDAEAVLRLVALSHWLCHLDSSKMTVAAR